MRHPLQDGSAASNKYSYGDKDKAGAGETNLLGDPDSSASPTGVSAATSPGGWSFRKLLLGFSTASSNEQALGEDKCTGSGDWCTGSCISSTP